MKVRFRQKSTCRSKGTRRVCSRSASIAEDSENVVDIEVLVLTSTVNGHNGSDPVVGDGLVGSENEGVS